MGNPSMSLLGQEGLVSHLPSLICEKKVYLFIYLFFFFTLKEKTALFSF